MTFRSNIRKNTLRSQFRKVLYTSPHLQLVTMRVTKDIPKETHPFTTQFIRVEKGTGIAIIGRKKFRLKKNTALVIPPGKSHHIIRTGKSDLFLYTIYSPPEHH